MSLDRKRTKKRRSRRKPRARTKSAPPAGRARTSRVELERKLAEAIERQTATAEILKVINSSAGDLRPVVEAMLASAVKLCEASYGAMWLREGDVLRNAAFHGEMPRGGR